MPNCGSPASSRPGPTSPYLWKSTPFPSPRNSSAPRQSASRSRTRYAVGKQTPATEGSAGVPSFSRPLREVGISSHSKFPVSPHQTEVESVPAFAHLQAKPLTPVVTAHALQVTKPVRESRYDRRSKQAHWRL